MYSVSNAYKDAIDANIRTVEISGTVTLTDGSTIPINDKSILQGSLYINSRCVCGDDFDLGSTYASELGMSFRYTGDISKLQDAKVSLTFGLYTHSTGFERIPLGKFTVNEISRNSGYVKLICIDEMLSFDKKMDTSELISYPNKEEYKFSKALRNIPEWCCSKCGLSSAYVPKSKFDNYPNADTMVSFLKCRSDLPTYRDLLEAALQLMGCFGFINRYGYFDVKHYTNEVVYKSTPYNRFTLTSSDYEVNTLTASWKGITLSAQNKGTIAVDFDNNMFLAEFDKASSDTYITVGNYLRNIRDTLKDISYSPCTISYMGNPALDIGDMIEVNPILPSLHQYTYGELEAMTYEELEQLIYGQSSDANLGIRYNAILMQHNWVYRGKSTIYCYGKSSKLKKVFV